MRTNPYSGDREDDLERFFRRSAWKVSAADTWRFFAVCQAVREIRAKHRRK